MKGVDHPELASLLQAVLVGETPPGILADWLEERGDDRAAAVRAASSPAAAVAIFIDWSEIVQSLATAFAPLLATLRRGAAWLRHRTEPPV